MPPVSEAGKGDKRRPTQVSVKQFEDNWERIFGKKRTPEKPSKALKADPVGRPS